MGWTAPATAVTGDIIPASFWNTNGRDNLNYLKGLTDGTGGATTVIVPSQLTVWNDGNFFLAENGNGPYINWDTGNDLLQFFRADNTLRAYIANVLAWQVNGSGKMTGAGIFRSASTSIAAAGNVAFTHGLGAKPIVLGGLYGTPSGSEVTPIYNNFGNNALYFSSVSSTVVVVSNSTAATQWAVIVAIL